MDNIELIKKLDIVLNKINDKNYNDAVDHIEQIKFSLMFVENDAEDYMKKLMNDLK